MMNTANLFFVSVHVESHCFLKSHEILEEAVKVMITKCDVLLTELNKYLDD